MLTVVLFGIGTDYMLFLLFRYRERLRAGDVPRDAIVGRGRAGRRGDLLGRVRGDRRVRRPGAGRARLLPDARPGAGHRRRGDAARRADARTGDRGRARPVRVLAVAPDPRDRGPAPGPRGPVRGRRPVRRPPPGARARRRRASPRRRWPGPPCASTRCYDPIAQLPANTEATRAYQDLKPGFPAGSLNPTTVYLTGRRADRGRPRSATSRRGIARCQGRGHAARRRSRPRTAGRSRYRWCCPSSRTAPQALTWSPARCATAARAGGAEPGRRCSSVARRWPSPTCGRPPTTTSG